jgi:transposase-like protein
VLHAIANDPKRGYFASMNKVLTGCHISTPEQRQRAWDDYTYTVYVHGTVGKGPVYGCVVHFYRNVWTAVPSGKVKEVAAMLKAIHAQEDAKAAKEKACQIIQKLKRHVSRRG